MNNVHVQVMNEIALSLAGSWEDERSAQEIVKGIRKSRSTKRLKAEFLSPSTFRFQSKSKV
jgi:hypothetical protein